MAKSRVLKFSLWAFAAIVLAVGGAALYFWLTWGARDYEAPSAEQLRHAADAARDRRQLPVKEQVLAAIKPGASDEEVDAFLRKLTETHELIWIDSRELDSGEEGFSLQEKGARVVFKSEGGKITRVEFREPQAATE